MILFTSSFIIFFPYYRTWAYVTHLHSVFLECAGKLLTLTYHDFVQPCLHNKTNRNYMLSSAWLAKKLVYRSFTIRSMLQVRPGAAPVTNLGVGFLLKRLLGIMWQYHPPVCTQVKENIGTNTISPGCLYGLRELSLPLPLSAAIYRWNEVLKWPQNYVPCWTFHHVWSHVFVFRFITWQLMSY